MSHLMHVPDDEFSLATTTMDHSSSSSSEESTSSDVLSVAPAPSHRHEPLGTAALLDSAHAIVTSTPSSSNHNPYGYGDDIAPRRRRPKSQPRPRRRGSVTKYSLEAQKHLRDFLVKTTSEDQDPNTISLRSLLIRSGSESNFRNHSKHAMRRHTMQHS